MVSSVKRLLTLGFLLTVSILGAQADPRADALNSNTLGLLASETQWLAEAMDLANVLQHQNGLRILPIAGSGSIQAVSDLVFIDGIDAALIPADALTYAQAQGLTKGMGGSISYVARLQQIELVLVARIEFADIKSLAGKRIATGPAQSGSFASGELIFGANNLDFLRVPRQGAGALQALERGQADAALVTVDVLAEAQLNPAEFHIVTLSVPESLSGTYVPAIITPEEVPGLVAIGQAYETIASSLAIAVFSKDKNSKQHEKLKKFSAALFASGAEIAGQKNPTNLSADIPGWTRHGAAVEALAALTSDSKLLVNGDGQ